MTGGHYYSRKLSATDIHRDVTLRCYVTSCSRTSLEVRTDALQINPSTGEEQLINFCHTTMVILDGTTLRPCPGAVPPLALGHDIEDREKQVRRSELSDLHTMIRKERNGSTMQIRVKGSKPPSHEEMITLHELHRKAVIEQEQEFPRPEPPRSVAENTFRSSFIIFPGK